jgi:TPR repeat protein
VNGQGVPRDFGAAARYFERSSDKGHPPAQYLYGVCLETGRGVPRDVAAAARYFRLSADQDHVPAQ